jgi:serine/threonine-protein kinase
MADPEAPICNPSDFIGHAGLIRRIFSRIGAERPQSVAVIGGKKSGKTSLLTYLADTSVRERCLEEPQRFVFAHESADSEMSRDPEGFLSGLERLLPSVPDGFDNRYERLRHAIEALHTEGRRFVILLDDFHLITRNQRFPLEFFSFLRSLANNYNLAYVTTSFLELQKLCAIKDVQESPFFNIFTNLSLGMLGDGESVDILHRSMGLADGLSSRVAAWCGGSPYVLKKSAARLSREKSPEGLLDEELEKILLPELIPYFEDVISILHPEARGPLQDVARGKSPAPSESHILGPLVKQGFLVEKGEGIASFSPAFQAFLKKGLTAKMFRGNG